MSGNKICKTEIKRNSRPAWEHTCPLWVFPSWSQVIGSDSFLTRAFSTAELSSILSLRLKHVRGWFGPVLLGSVNIRTEVLLDRCENGQRDIAVPAPPLVTWSNFILL